MGIKVSADEAAWQLREAADGARLGIREAADGARVGMRDAADQARWSAREAAWSLEERLLWPTADAGRSALRRAAAQLAPLQRLIQTKLVWPLGDRLDDYGTGARTALATTAALAALGAGVAGAKLAAPGESDPERIAAAPVAAFAPQPEGASLQGVVPDFAGDPNPRTGDAARTSAPATPAGEEPTPEQVAWRFAHAFALYEVGRLDEKVAESFAESASRSLAAALRSEPPRLPAAGKVPEAKVLNVVRGERDGGRLAVSVSLLRLQAASELRLTLRETAAGWRVVEVLG